jgi:tetratricopeptide (TPR) repeat protein
MSDERDPVPEAWWYVETGYPREALEALRGASPVDTRVMCVRGHALAALGEVDEAIDEARRGLELEPENLDLLDLLASSQMSSNPNAAEVTLRRALELSPENPRLLALYVLILIEQRRFEWGEKLLERLMRIDPESDMTHRVRTLLMLRASRSAEALTAARELLREYPDEAFAHYLQGLAMLSGKWWRGLRHLRQAAAMRPQEPLLTETARMMGAWYLLPAHATSGAMNWVFFAVFLALFIFDLSRDDTVSPLWAAFFFGYLAYKTLAFVIANAVLGRRIARAQREL